MKDYYVTLNQFSDFALKNSIQKYNSAQKIFKQVTTEFDTKQDYWLQLRNRIKRALKTTGKVDALNGLENEVNKDKRNNYSTMLSGLKKYWGKKIFERVDLRTKIWKSGHIKIRVSPQLCYSYRGKVHIVDLYLHINEKIDKRKADLILQVMHDTLKLDEEVSIEILDVARGKTFKYQSANTKKLSLLAKLEAKELEGIFENLISEQ